MGLKVVRLVLNGISISYSETRKPRPCPRCAYCGEGDYWNVVWPAGIGLCRYVTDRFDRSTVRRWKVVDLGCGTGIGGLCLGMMGAHVTFVDHIPNALDVVEKNCRRNGINVFRTLCCCWRNPATLRRMGRYDVVLGGDILYSANDARWVAAFVETALKPRGTAVFSDPGRNGCDIFSRRLARSGFQTTVKSVGASRAHTQRMRIVIVKRY